TDTVVSRLTETIMAFPLILFLVFTSVRLSDTLEPIGYGSAIPDGVFLVGLLIGLFTWFYPARLVRAEMLTLRNAEYVAAARSVGASEARIVRRHLLPHVVPGLLVWAAIAIAANILLEVGLSFVGVGVQPQTPTWGSMLSQVWGTIFAPGRYNDQTSTQWQTILPRLAIALTVVALTQLAEGFRRAFDPWSSGCRPMRRILTFFLRRLGAGMFTLVTMITLTFVLFWAIPSDPANFVYPSAQH